MLDTKVESKPKEGKVAKEIEQRTKHIPSDVFLWTALGFLGASAIIAGVGARNGGRTPALFLAQLAPVFLVLGLYNKVVKVAGSDQHEDVDPTAHPYGA